MSTAAVIVCSIIFSMVGFLIFVMSAYGYYDPEEKEVNFYDESERDE